MSITYKYNVNSHIYISHIVQALTKDYIFPSIFFLCATEISMHPSNYSYVRLGVAMSVLEHIEVSGYND